MLTGLLGCYGSYLGQEVLGQLLVWCFTRGSVVKFFCSILTSYVLAQPLLFGPDLPIVPEDLEGPEDRLILNPADHK